MANERFMKQKARAMLKPHCYVQSMSSLATSGTPDLWLSGKKDCFIEWKHDEITKGPILPKLSALQKQWCDGRHAEGRQVIVVVTTDSRTGIIYRDGAWNAHNNNRIPLKDIITQILKLVS